MLVWDYSSAASPWNNPNWGTGAKGVTDWYAEYDGVAGVQAFGMQDNSSIQYTMWTAVLPEFDYSGYTHITFRLKANKSALRALYVLGVVDGDFQSVNILPDISQSNVWTTVTLEIADIPSFYLGISNVAGHSGETVWLDAVYVQ